MSNLSVQSRPVQPVGTLPSAPAAPAQPQKTTEAPSQLQQDSMSWSEASTSSRIGAAATEVFKETALPYTIGGALAVPVGSAVLGGMIGLFSGDPVGVAKAAVVATAKYIPLGAAAGLGVSGIQSGVMGTVVGTSPDKEAAAVRMGTLTAVVGVLTAEEPEDLLGVGVETAYNATMAARIFDKAEARIAAGE